MAAFGTLMRILSGRPRGGERRAPSAGFLGRIARSEAGNVMAMMAIAIFPLAGLVGGALDMSRIYLVKMRLQQACDAGTLAGRRIMGAGQWSANNNAANNAALQFFDNNFATNAYGTTDLTRSFTEAAGRVTGTASATVPMTLMRIFGSERQVVAVACDAEMRLPNTDVMFVLDTTGSMAQTLPGDSSTKIDALRFAVKCFYETVARLDTTAQCDPDGAPGPTGGTGTQTQIRFGFVPYSTNVNVGKLLHNDWLADSWEYQTRTPRTTPIHAWNPGSDVDPTSWSAWSARPGSYANASGYGSFTLVTADTVVNGTTYNRRRTAVTSSANCTAQNNVAGSGNTLVAIQETDGTAGSPSYGAYTPAAPVYGTHSQQTRTATQTQTQTMRGYRYRWFDPSGSTDPQGCYLERSATSTYNRTSTGTGSRPLTWTQYQRFDGWRYQRAPLTTSGLERGESSWNDSVSLPLSTTTVSNVRVSGSSSTSTLTIPANVNVAWAGCIEERHTERASSYTAGFNGPPVQAPTPSTALDLDIDAVPSTETAGSSWGPALPGAVYLRGYSLDSNGNLQGSPNYNPFVDHNGNYFRADETAYPNTRFEFTPTFCGSEARKLKSWATSDEVDEFEGYVDGLTPTGNTHHDIGLLWGARFMSPTGIFASENATTSEGGEIERHMIFMTDGETCTNHINYAAYGIPAWDRRQTSDTSVPTSGCDDADSDGGTLSQQVNARFSAICTAVRNKNITLWVVYFGSADTDTVNRMTACATSGRFFYANNSAGLISSFRTIADQISQLRLTR
jgi:Flp pilus assembly protein TadG